jgi:hypothetical protein
MADDKTINLEVITPRRRIELREFTLAAFYPETQPATPLPAITDVQPLQRRQRDNPSPSENVAKPWKKPWDK